MSIDADHPRLVASYDGALAQFVVMRTYDGKFAVEQHFLATDGFAVHQTFVSLDRAKALAKQLAERS